MTSRIFLALALVFVLAGCSTFNDAELSQLRQRGLRPALLAKMEHRRPLEPDDLVALRRAGVPDAQVVKHLNDVGINYVPTREDVARLRKARVGASVMDALFWAAERFAGRETYRPYDSGWFYGDPWAPYFFGGGLGFGYELSRHSWHGGRGGHRQR